MEWSPPGCSVHAISQARILEWVFISFCRGPSQTRIKLMSPLSPALAGRFLSTDVCSNILLFILYFGCNSKSIADISLCLLSYFSHVGLFVTSGTVAHQAPWSVDFSRQAYWTGMPCPPSRDLPHPGIEPLSPVSPALQVDSLLLSHQGSPDISTHTPPPKFIIYIII